jgi:superfamily II DNA or RNA helicase
MLDEGINLANCRVGIYANLNSSDRIIVQRLGRLLRHPEPIIVIPYYRNTRDEEIVKKMCENYNSELIKTITNINEIKL